MRTLIEVLKLSADFLQQKGIVHPRRQAEELLCDALSLKRMQLYTEHDRPLTTAEIDLLRLRLGRRAKGEPAAYIHGSVAFYECTLKVTPDVLIPRQETEILVDKISTEIAGQELQGKALWDICTGSGCMGVALKKRFPQLQVTLSDLSERALQIASENAQLNGVEVELVQGDLLAPFQGRKADYIVCNPPYVTEAEFVSLDREVKDFEPKMALVSGSSGLEFYHRLAKELPSHLKPGGRLWLEMGTGQGEALLKLFQQAPWKGTQVQADWAGHDRFLTLSYFP